MANIIFGEDQIYKLIEKFESSNITELELESGGTRFHLKREVPVTQSHPAPVVISAPAPQAPPLPAAVPVSATADNLANVPQSGDSIVAPMLGSFYRSPSPDAEPFVKVGDKVKAGDVICIIEAMKVMNEVKAERDCTIMSIEVEDGSLVEYNQVLMKIG